MTRDQQRFDLHTVPNRLITLTEDVLRVLEAPRDEAPEDSGRSRAWLDHAEQVITGHAYQVLGGLVDELGAHYRHIDHFGYGPAPYRGGCRKDNDSDSDSAAARCMVCRSTLCLSCTTIVEVHYSFCDPCDAQNAADMDAVPGRRRLETQVTLSSYLLTASVGPVAIDLQSGRESGPLPISRKRA